MSYGTLTIIAFLAGAGLLLFAVAAESMFVLLMGLFCFVGAGVSIANDRISQALMKTCTEQEQITEQRELTCTVPMEVIIKDGAAWDFRYPKRPAQAAASE